MDGSSWLRWAERFARWSFWLIVINLAVWFLLGVLAALIGGPLTNLGNGLGGGWGMADLLFGLAMLLALPSLFVGFYDLFKKRSGAVSKIMAYIFALTIALGYIFIAHSLDPCFLGIWTIFSKLGAIPLCEFFGPELNIHTRFHLLWHVLPTLPLVLLYGLILKRQLFQQNTAS